MFEMDYSGGDELLRMVIKDWWNAEIIDCVVVFFPTW